MDRDTIDRDTLQDMVDSCRPGSQDVHEPEMQPLADAIAKDEKLGRAYQATQRADARIGQAFQNVAPPAGLATRILGSLDLSVDESPVAERAFPTASRWNRRRLLVAGMAIASTVAASVVAMIYIQPGPERDISNADDRRLIVQEWSAEVDAEGPGWSSTEITPDGFPPPRSMRFPAWRWKMLTSGKVVCYELHPTEPGRVLVFVASRPASGLPSSPQIPGPSPYPGHVLSTAWVRDGLVYVLTVHADDGAHQLLLQKALRTNHA